MSALLSFAVNFSQIECCNCGSVFAMTQQMQLKRREDGKYFFCPNGHQQHYVGETALQKLQKELDQEKKRRTWAEESRDASLKRENEALASRNAMKGVVTKIKKRVGNGVCPCCNRSFKNLQQHMGTEHPDFSEEKDQT